mgnify:CR=1 FL=1
MESIISAILAGAVTLIGVLIANGKSQAVTDTKLEELTREVREHNNFARRVPILEEQMKVANHRIADLEKERNDTHCKISAATLARTAALALALTNQVLSACGKPMLPIESATVEQLVTTGLTVAAALAGWWKNNSFTPEAIEADGYLEKLRKEK